MLEIGLLRTFIAIVDHGGFSAAANHLHLTQSAVSGHLRRLEAIVGTPLIQRTTRTWNLTPDGDRLVAHARAILALNNDALSLFTQPPATERVRIGMAEEFARTPLLKALRQCASQHPGLTFEVQMGLPGAMLARMAEGQLDIVLGSQCEAQGGGRLLWTEPLVWAWGKPALGNLPSPLPLALFPEPCPYRAAALARLAQADVPQQIVMTCTNNAALRAAAESGFAVAPMAQSQLGPGLVALSTTDGLPELPLAHFQLFLTEHSSCGRLEIVANALIESLQFG